MNFWLFKSEPDEYSIDDLANEPNATGRWDGIRNYQARNLIRDDIKIDDKVLFYHSSCKDVGVAGIAKVVSAPYPDPSQFEPNNKYYDEKSTESNPRWFCVDIAFEHKAKHFLSLKEIKHTDELSEMTLVKQGRLSIQPVSAMEWNYINQRIS
jgi:predicted RNA-binding protein with PUA-like domain